MEYFAEQELVLKELLKPLYTELLSDSESSTSFDSLSDDEIAVRRKKVKVEEYVERVVPRYSDTEFKAHFRINRRTAFRVIEKLKNSQYIPTHKDGREKITAEKAFLLTVWYLSNEETFRQVADRFNVTLSSAHRCLQRVLKFLLSIKSTVIKWPTDAEINNIKEGFRRKKGIQGVIGAIDGSHVEILKPREDQMAYINRKGYHSLLLQVIVDNNKKFLDVYCGEPGSMHDARLLRKSGIYAKIYNNPNFMGDNFILGDTAYPNLSWLVTPFKDNGQLTANQREFNYRISATRVIVEHALGLLKGRFRRLRKLDNINKITCSKLIMGACILHNICINEGDFIDAEPHDFNQPAQHVMNNLDINVGEPHQLNRQQQLFNLLYN